MAVLIAFVSLKCSQNKNLYLSLNAEYSFYTKRPHFMKKINESKLTNYHKAIKNLKNITKRQKEKYKYNGYNFSYSLIDISAYGKFYDILSFNICDTYLETPLRKIHKIICELKLPEDIINTLEDFCFGGNIEEILRNLYKDGLDINNLEIVDLVDKGPFLDINYIEGANICVCFLDKSLYKNAIYMKGFENNIDFEKKWIKSYKLESGDTLLTLEDASLDDNIDKNSNCYAVCIISKIKESISKQFTHYGKIVMFPYDTQVVPKGCGKNSILLYSSIHKQNRYPIVDADGNETNYIHYNVYNPNELLEFSLEKLAIVYNFKENKDLFVKSRLNICVENDFYKEAKACFDCFVFFVHLSIFWHSVVRSCLNKAAILVLSLLFCLVFPLKISIPLFYTMLIHNTCLSSYNMLMKGKFNMRPNTIQILYEAWCEFYVNSSSLAKFMLHIAPIFGCLSSYYYTDYVRILFNAIVILQMTAYLCYYEFKLVIFPLLLIGKPFTRYPKTTLTSLYFILGIMAYFTFLK